MFLQPGEEQDASNEVPNKNEKGIEMEQDFAADAQSVSEDSAEDNNDDDREEEQLESAMGETGANSEAVDEKLWGKDEDEPPSNSNEKYESGSSVRDRDTSSRELRAKEDSAATTDEPGALNADEPGELNSDELDKQDDEIGSEDNLADRENIEDMKLDKEEAFADPTGLNPDESNQCSDEDMDTDERRLLILWRAQILWRMRSLMRRETARKKIQMQQMKLWERQRQNKWVEVLKGMILVEIMKRMLRRI